MVKKTATKQTTESVSKTPVKTATKTVKKTKQVKSTKSISASTSKEKIPDSNTETKLVNLNKKDEQDNDEQDNDEQDNDEEDDSEGEYEYTDEFKKKVKDYVKNDDRIRELQTELKVLNNAKKAAEMEILKHLERLGESNVNITGGKLRINQYESKEGLKEDLIKEALSEKIKDPTIIQFIFDKINEKRVANGKIQKSIKRTFERGDNKKDKK